MNILGVGGLIHNASAALLVDGKLVAAVEEERFSRRKNDGFYGFASASSGLPWRSISYCLKEAGMAWGDVDDVGYYFDPWLEYRHNCALNIGSLLKAPTKFGYRLLSDTDLLKSHLKARALVLAKNPRARFHFVQHHLTHAASAFYASGFENSLILINDGRGEVFAAGLLRGEERTIRKLDGIPFPHSLGMLFMEVTQYLGFRGGEDEYKVMGLASYAEPTMLDKFRKLILVEDGRTYRLNMKYFKRPLIGPGLLSSEFYALFGPERKSGEPILDRHMEVAASLQALLEEVIIKFLTYYVNATNVRNLCIAGGVGLNSVLNGHLLASKLFHKIFVPPAAGDAGCSVGACYHVDNLSNSNARNVPLSHAFLGPSYPDEQIKYYLDQAKLKYLVLEDVAKETAKILRQGKIIGWYQGRMEFGPRALGARSIIADPTRAEMKDTINKWVKHREDFRPFAPSVLKEKAAEYFDDITDSPFMLFITNVKENKRHLIPAVTHIDGTARPQTVEKQTNPLYYRLIEEFEILSGVPVILNTSFNVMGEPIVESPEQAIRCFFGTGIDCLVIGKFLLTK